jgi:acetyltransferase EpsM
MAGIPTLLVGAGGHARVLADIIHLSPGLELVAVLDDDPARRGSKLGGVEILGPTGLMRERPRGVEACVIGIGRNSTRARFFEQARALGYELPAVVHPSCVIAADVVLPAGLCVMAGAVVNPGGELGVDVVLNTHCSVDHDNRIGDHAHLHPGAVLAGGVEVGAYTYIGTNATVNPYLKVGARSMVGSGAVVTGNIPDGVVAVGVPARVIRAWDGV